VNFQWRDHQKQLHQEAIAKEALKLWIMPPEYHESWKRHFMFHRPIPAILIEAGEAAKVYGFQTHHIVNRPKFEARLKEAIFTSWPNSPHDEGSPLSWKSWRKDLKTVLKKGELEGRW
jgi:hypothetical protein